MKNFKLFSFVLIFACCTWGSLLANSTGESDTYLKKRIEKFKSINLLNNSQIGMICEQYELLNNSQDYKRNFEIAVSRIIHSSDVIYKLYQEEIDALCEVKLTTASEWYMNKYNINKNQTESINKLLTERIKKGLIGAYLYPENLKQKYAYQQDIIKQYNESIIKTLTKNGVKTELQSYCPSLSDADFLQLSDNQKGQLIDKAWEIWINRKEVSPKKEEEKILTQILTPQQYLRYTGKKNGNMRKSGLANNARTPESVYQENKKKIDALVDTKFPEISTWYINKYNLTSVQMASVADILKERIRKGLIASYLYSDDANLKYKYQQEILNQYHEPIIKTLTQNGVDTELKAYCNSLRFADTLKLTNKQRELLINKAWKIWINRKSISPKIEEYKYLASILSSQQYDNYMLLQAEERATAVAERIWGQALQLEVCTENDRNSEFPKLLTYYTKRIAMQDGYKITKNKAAEREYNLGEYDRQYKPTLMKKIYAAEKMLRNKNNNSRKNSLIW